MARKGQPQLSRRKFLKNSSVTVAGGTLAAGLVGTSTRVSGDTPTGTVFNHGVASGDPTQTSVILWTKADPVQQPPEAEIPLHYEIAPSPDFPSNATIKGTVKARIEADHTAKVDVSGLQPGTKYWYRFRKDNDYSATARTNTLPSAPDKVRIALVSCSSHPHGYFNVYGILASDSRFANEDEPDVILHLGDYIYEYMHGEYGDVRQSDPVHEITTLDDYRTRHKQYKKDADLMALHHKYPMINIWDDHESADNSWPGGAFNHNPENGEGEWATRLSAAKQAYFEYIPIREFPNADGRIYRKFTFGSLATLLMLDTRLERNAPEAAGPQDQSTIADPARSLLGEEQEAWLDGEMAASNSTWTLLGQQIMVGQLKVAGTPENPAVQGGVIFNTDQWDGYAASRIKLWDAIESVNARLGNCVVLTGDIHTSWAMDITRDPNNIAHYDPVTGRGSIAVEFVCPSVTSHGLPELAPVQDGIRTMNPHMKYIDLEKHGYMILDVDHTRVEGTWWYVDSVTEENAYTEQAGPTFYCEANTRYLQKKDSPIPIVRNHSKPKTGVA